MSIVRTSVRDIARVVPDQLSIVLQGGLDRGNLVQTALHCQHWRALFPDAEIVLSLSGTDMLRGRPVDGLLADPAPVRAIATDTEAVSAIRVLDEACDLIALSGEALPLPPIKADANRPNNLNHQIAAARNGLRHATRRHVLRTRSDLIFLDAGFLAQYEEMAALPRGGHAVLRDRVMISWLYTLNPYTIERLPLHFSDWFHLGRLEDVRALWDVPYMALADALHFRTHAHPARSSEGERLFNTRLAVEQHLMLNALGRLVPELRLDSIGDRSSLRLSLELLADNFALCDLAAARCVFPKYDFEFDRHEKQLHCLTPQDWRLLVANRGVDPALVLSHRVREVADVDAFEREEGFPRTFPASRLKTKCGHHANGEIVVSARRGIALYGPHVAIPPGAYRATVAFTTLEGPGRIVLRATLDQGGIMLAERRVRIAADGERQLSIDFELTTPGARDFEIVAELIDIPAAAIASLTIETRSNRPESRHLPEAVAAPRPQLDLAAAATEADAGRWHRVAAIEPLRLGRYHVALDVAALAGRGAVTVRAVARATGLELARRRLDVAEDEAEDIGLPLDVIAADTGAIDVECRVDGLARLVVPGVLVVQRVAEARDDGATLAFSPLHLSTRIGRFDGDALIAAERTGVLSYGPYVSLAPGDYRATFGLRGGPRVGRMVLTVTTDVGNALLARRRLRLSQLVGDDATIDFTVAEPGAEKLEIVCSIRGASAVAVRGLAIAPALPPAPAPPVPTRPGPPRTGADAEPHADHHHRPRRNADDRRAGDPL